MTVADQPNTETITITQHMLGLDPYVLICFELDNDQDMVAKIEVGGGCDDVRTALLFALAGMEPLTAEEVEMLTAVNNGVTLTRDSHEGSR